jgi:uncharacterized metal-binding protein
MSVEVTKVGIISCSGEAMPEGSISRFATRRVLELLRPNVTVTLCLPLFLAGNEGERNFARTHPTITVDGCEKQCARWGTEQHSGPVSAAIVVSEVLGTESQGCHCSSHDLSEEDTAAVWAVAERIAAEVDTVLATATPREASSTEPSKASCGCSSPLPGGFIEIRGKAQSIPGLPLIFEQCAAGGVSVEGEDGVALLNAVKIYHAIAPEEETEYRPALLRAYREFRSGAKAAK